MSAMPVQVQVQGGHPADKRVDMLVNVPECVPECHMCVRARSSQSALTLNPRILSVCLTEEEMAEEQVPAPAVDRRVLGPAILRTPDSTQHVPDHWRDQLLDSTDKDNRSVVAYSCKSGLRWCLEEREQATLTLHIPPSAAERPAVLARRLRAARDQLVQRGDSKRTTLHLRQTGQYPQAEPWWDVVFPALSPGTMLRTSTLVLHIATGLSLASRA